MHWQSQEAWANDQSSETNQRAPEPHSHGAKTGICEAEQADWKNPSLRDPLDWNSLESNDEHWWRAEHV